MYSTAALLIGFRAYPGRGRFVYMGIAAASPTGLQKTPNFIQTGAPFNPAVGIFVGTRSSFGFDEVEFLWKRAAGLPLPADSITVQLYRFAADGVLIPVGSEVNLRHNQPQKFYTGGANDFNFKIVAVNTSPADPVTFHYAGASPVRLRE
jgi:hypothetical protein